MTVEVSGISRKFNELFPSRLNGLIEDLTAIAKDYYKPGDDNDDKLWKKMRGVLASGADINGVNSSGQTALCLLCSRGWRTNAIQKLVTEGAEVSKADNDDTTPLIHHAYATSWGVRAETLKFLLDNGANPNAVDKYGRSALTGLLRDGFAQDMKDKPELQARHCECVKELTSRGVVPTREQMDDIFEHMRWLIPAVPQLAGMMALDEAVRKNDVAKAKSLMAGGVSPDFAVRFRQMEMPLGIAAENGSLEMIDALIDGGANVNQRSAKFHRPIESAAWAGQKAAFLKLLDKGGDPTVMGRGGDGLTMLEWLQNSPARDMKEFVAPYIEHWKPKAPDLKLHSDVKPLKAFQVKPALNT